MYEAAERTSSHREAFRDELIAAGLITPMREGGLYAFSATFESIIDGINRILSDLTSELRFERIQFPPVVSNSVFDKTDYATSFPNLMGSIHSFSGDATQHATLMGRRARGEDWSDLLAPSGLMLAPAACHQVYALATGALPEQGRRVDVQGQCFRREPSDDPTRMQAFRMREFVRLGTQEEARTHRWLGIDHGLALLDTLGLVGTAAPASDPFFGRFGTVLAENQLERALKTELLVSTDHFEGVAVASSNYHEQHFSSAFEIYTSSGELAETSCVGYGLERLAMAVLSQHGPLPGKWPRKLRGLLCPN